MRTYRRHQGQADCQENLTILGILGMGLIALAFPVIGAFCTPRESEEQQRPTHTRREIALPPYSVDRFIEQGKDTRASRPTYAHPDLVLSE